MRQLEISLYDALGGEAALSSLVEHFYKRVYAHPQLLPIFPEDRDETIRKQKQFLTQFCGGPALYTKEHGHPRLRARHLPFPITPTRARAWLQCMEAALEECHIDEQAGRELYRRLAMTAQHMVNTEDE